MDKIRPPIVRQIRAALERSAERPYPVRLAPIAKEFQIRPTPRAATGTRPSLEFDEQLREFVIRIPRGSV
jgi:hypothetical protein